MKKKHVILIVLMLNFIFQIRAQTVDFNQVNVNFVALSDFDSLTYHFYNEMYDSIKSQNNEEFIIRFKYSEMELFKFKYGYENPNHQHILSFKSNDASTFAIEVVSKMGIDNFWVVGNDKIVNESDFRFINSVYSDLFSKDFLLQVKEWSFNKSDIFKLSNCDSIKIYSYLNNNVIDDWDCFVIKSAINRVTKPNLEADAIRIETLRQKKLKPVYTFITGFDFLNSRISDTSLTVILNVHFSPSYFDGYRYQKVVKNKFYNRCSTLDCEFVGVYDLKKFRKVHLQESKNNLVVWQLGIAE